jgi:oligopeptide transport system substrate-binding protein
MNRPTTPDQTFDRFAGRQLLMLGLASIAGITLLMLALGWASSLTGSSAGASQAVDPASKTITLHMSTEPPQLNSSLATDMLSGMVLGHVMEGLLRYDANNQLAPGVAERWEITARGATFWLRRDALWSDGEPVTAHDFVFAWRLALDPDNASEYAFILHPIKNAEAITRGEMPVESLGAFAVDKHTLRVELERPIAYFDKLVAFPTYYPIREDFYRQTYPRYGAEADTLLYNGAFALTRWIHGAHLRMEKNPAYWNKAQIRINVLDFPYITTDTNAALNLFKDNKIAHTGLAAENLNDAMEQRWHIQRFMDGSVFFVEYNFRPGRATGNFHLRKAIQLAVDPAELVYKVTKLPGYLPGESIFPVWLKGVNGFFRQEYPAPTPKLDLAAAREHLEQARKQLGVQEIPPLVLLTGDNPLSSVQSEYFQQVLRKNLGLDIKIDKQIFKQRLAKMTAGEFDMVMAGWGPDYDDPLTFGDLFASWNPNNRGRYANPELDRQVDIAKTSLDAKTRMDAFAEIQRILIEDAAILPNYERGTTYVVNPAMRGMVRRAVGLDPDYTYAYIAEP